MTSARLQSQRQLQHGLADSSYQRSAGELIQLVDKMRDAGAHHTIDLPTMVVCGNQSAGKSSLLERLTEVTLPKDKGTCTKCPTEVRMSSSSHDGRWHCDLKLRRDYNDANGATLPESHEVMFASLEGAKGQRKLVHYIKAAQRALLNPGQPPKGFVEMAHAAAGGGQSDGEGPPPQDELKFTKNAVVLVIKGARADLTLIDLPGIIQSDEDNPGNMALVKDLVEGYIKRERAIIVAAISCKDDINNQAIVEMARTVDPKRERTIGVLTKPDRIEAATHDQWVPILKGDKFPLSLGYYAVRNMSQEDLNNGMSLQDAEKQEASFFADDDFWSSSEVVGAAGRFGITNLLCALSRALVNLTRKELPAMSSAIAAALRQVEVALSDLPPEPSADPMLDLLHAIQALHTSVSAILDGTAKDTHFLRLVMGKYKELRNSDILSTAPLFVLDRDEEVPQLQPDDDGSYDIENSDFWLSDGMPDDGRRSIITLADVQEVVKQHPVKELPGQMPAVVLVRLIQDNRQAWGSMILTRLQEVAVELQVVLEKEVKAAFQRYPRALGLIRGLVNELHHDIVEDTRTRLESLMAMEEANLNIFTLDDHYYLASRDALMAEMGRMRLEATNMEQPDEATRNKITGMLESIGWKVEVEQLMALAYKNRPETNAAEEDWCNMIASTLAYYKVGCKRITDGVCMHINHHLLGGFGPRLHDLLMQQLILSTKGGSGGSGGSGGGAVEEGEGFSPVELMAEDGHVAAQRQDLLAKQKRLQEAQRILNQL